ncbi:alpha/beta fold hydrolase [Amycolatopsis nigrescens]|uniref:alpha/beta fold hydrolase n=1 Tax=Amycolatopsis nigrescens TaxID=381445 RepID=UPI0003774291|nr:alpha/beta hydrolase [Amycolatopsis nigrescens]
MDNWQLEHTYRGASGVLRWSRHGAPDAEPVVLLHGTPFSSYVWRDIARALSRYYRVYVWDMPGYGRSEKSEGQDLSLDALTATFADLLDHWQLDRPRVVAHDSGGALALGAHLLHGVPYRQLALVDAVALSPWGSRFSELVGGHSDVFAELPIEPHAAMLHAYTNSASGPGLHPATLEAHVAPWLTEAGRPAFYRQLKARLRDQGFTDALRDKYRELDLPVLLCWGEQDTWVPVERGRELADLVPGARLHTTPGAGHLLPEDAPASLAVSLFDFLSH